MACLTLQRPTDRPIDSCWYWGFVFTLLGARFVFTFTTFASRFNRSLGDLTFDANHCRYGMRDTALHTQSIILKNF